MRIDGKEKYINVIKMEERRKEAEKKKTRQERYHYSPDGSSS